MYIHFASGVIASNWTASQRPNTSDFKGAISVSHRWWTDCVCSGATVGPTGTCASAVTESSLSLSDALCGSPSVCWVSSSGVSVFSTGSGGGVVRGVLGCVAGGVGCVFGRFGRRDGVFVVGGCRSAGVYDWVGVGANDSVRVHTHHAIQLANRRHNMCNATMEL